MDRAQQRLDSIARRESGSRSVFVADFDSSSLFVSLTRQMPYEPLPASVFLGLASFFCGLSSLVVIGNQRDALSSRRNRALCNDGVPCPAVGIRASAGSDLNRMLREPRSFADGVRPLLASDGIDDRAGF